MKRKIIVTLFVFCIIILTFVACGEKYTVSFELNGGEMNTKTVEVEEGEYYALPVPHKLGYNFAGWYYNDTKIEIKGEWQYEQNITLSAKWEFATYQIEYELNGGSLENQVSSYNAKTEDFVIGIPTKKNHIFEHWLDQNGKKYDGEITIQKGSEGNLKLTAVWWDFVGDNGIEYSYDGTSLCVIGYKGDFSKSVVIPSKYYEIPVTAIGEYAFDGLGTKIPNSDMAYTFTMYIPKSIRSIGKYAFNNCNNLKLLLSHAKYFDSEKYRKEAVEPWLENTTIAKEGNGEILDVINMYRPAFGWSKYSIYE